MGPLKSLMVGPVVVHFSIDSMKWLMKTALLLSENENDRNGWWPFFISTTLWGNGFKVDHSGSGILNTVCWRRPIAYHSKQTGETERSSHVDAAGICQAWWHEGPPHCCSPFLQRATLPSDSSPERRSGTRPQVIINLHPFKVDFFYFFIFADASVYLWREVVLLQLPSLSQIPGADRVVEAAGPQLGAVVGDVDTAGSICVALELPAGYTRIHSELNKDRNV